MNPKKQTRLIKEKIPNRGEHVAYIHSEGMVYVDEAYNFIKPKKENEADAESAKPDKKD